MGKDKALLDFGGQPLIQHLLVRLNSLAQETIITTNHPDRYRFLNLPLIPDVIPDRGALGGLYTSLLAASHPLVAIVACDMPFASLKILQACRDMLMAEPDLDAVIPGSEHGLEPLHAVYRCDPCLPAVKAALDAGQWKVISWHPEVNVRVLPPEQIARLDPHGTAFENINTPEELKAAIQRAHPSANR
jgi:molybdopterin-guanine dinucleotide biosynthesis protein A